MRAAFEGSLPSLIGHVVFVTLLIAACVSDLRTRRIPNRLAGLLLICGLGAAIAIRGPSAGIASALTGAATGLAIWMPFWMLGMLGGGDVKLFAAGAAWVGPAQALEGALLAGLCGGVLALAYVLIQHGPTFTLYKVMQGVSQPSALRTEAPTAWEKRLPYALAMAAGLLLVTWRPGLLL